MARRVTLRHVWVPKHEMSLFQPTKTSNKESPINLRGQIDMETDALSVVGAQQLNVRSTPHISN